MVNIFANSEFIECFFDECRPEHIRILGSASQIYILMRELSDQHLLIDDNCEFWVRSEQLCDEYIVIICESLLTNWRFHQSEGAQNVFRTPIICYQWILLYLHGSGLYL